MAGALLVRLVFSLMDELRIGHLHDLTAETPRRVSDPVVPFAQVVMSFSPERT